MDFAKSTRRKKAINKSSSDVSQTTGEVDETQIVLEEKINEVKLRHAMILRICYRQSFAVSFVIF